MISYLQQNATQFQIVFAQDFFLQLCTKNNTVKLRFPSFSFFHFTRLEPLSFAFISFASCTYVIIFGLSELQPFKSAGICLTKR